MGRRSGPRLSALRYPLLEGRRVRNRQFERKPGGMRRAATLPHVSNKFTEKGRCRNCRTKHRREHVTRDCFASLAMTWMVLLENNCGHCEERAARRSNLCHAGGLDAPSAGPDGPKATPHLGETN